MRCANELSSCSRRPLRNPGRFIRSVTGSSQTEARNGPLAFVGVLGSAPRVGRPTSRATSSSSAWVSAASVSLLPPPASSVFSSPLILLRVACSASDGKQSAVRSVSWFRHQGDSDAQQRKPVQRDRTSGDATRAGLGRSLAWSSRLSTSRSGLGLAHWFEVVLAWTGLRCRHGRATEGVAYGRPRVRSRPWRRLSPRPDGEDRERRRSQLVFDGRRALSRTRKRNRQD